MAAEVVVDIIGRDNFSGVLGNFGNIMTGIKSTIDLVTGAFQAAADAVMPFINSAAESELVVTKMEAVLRATGSAAGLTSQELQNMANELQGVTRFSDETILTGASLLLTFRNIGEETMQRAIPAMLDMAEIFGSVDSAAMQLGKALNDPVNMMGALSRAGVTFSDAQKEAIKSMVEMGDIAGAQNIILTELEMQVGGVAEAVGTTFTGQLEIARNKLDGMRETIGTALLPILGDLLNRFMEFTETNPVIQGVLRFFERLGTALNSDSGFTYIESLAFAFASIRDLSPVFLDIAGALSAMQIALDQGATPLDAFKRALDNLILGDGPLATVAGFIKDIVTAFETGDWSTVWEKIRDQILTWWGNIKPVLNDFFAYMFFWMEQKVTEWIQGGGPARLSNGIINAINTHIATPEFQSKANIAARTLTDVLITAFVAVGNGLEVAGTNAMRNFWNGMEVGGTDALRNFMNNLERDITDGLRNGLNNVELGITDWVREKIVDPIKRFLGIASPSTVFMEIGKDIVRGLVGGLDSLVDWAIGMIKGIVADILSPFDSILDLLGIDLGGTTGTTGGRIPDAPDTRTPTTPGTGTVVNQYFSGATINVGSWDEIAYDCIYPNPFVAATSGQLGGSGAATGSGR